MKDIRFLVAGACLPAFGCGVTFADGNYWLAIVNLVVCCVNLYLIRRDTRVFA